MTSLNTVTNENTTFADQAAAAVMGSVGSYEDAMIDTMIVVTEEHAEVLNIPMKPDMAEVEFASPNYDRACSLSDVMFSVLISFKY